MASAHAILVVGGGQGIGLATTRYILTTSPTTTKVLVFGLHADPELEFLSQRYPERIQAVIGDVTNAADRLEAVDTCLNTYGRLDTLVYCAGIITPIERIERLDLDAVQRTYEVNVFGAMAMVCLPSHTLYPFNHDQWELIGQ
jgi:NAD(P)-dependent dehydrogenase (short-subunit alcohol dehydrogenase family)